MYRHYFYWLARLLSFKRPLLSVDVSVCLLVCVCVSATFMLNISETKRFRCMLNVNVNRKVLAWLKQPKLLVREVAILHDTITRILYGQLLN